MNVPKYIQRLLERCSFVLVGDYVPGYTIKLAKRNEYSFASTLRQDAERLVNWSNDRYQKTSKDDTIISELISYPIDTHYHQQYAIINIYDPIMKYLEAYIPTPKKKMPKIEKGRTFFRD